VTNWLSESPALYLIDMARREIDKTVPLGNKKAAARTPVFSPDGRWIAVITQVFPEEAARQEPAAEDLPQPRIHLVEAASGEVIETIIAPQGIATTLAFSPDGKTLASGGHGRVLLWDLSTPPGEWATR
jgi:WD40 repeat protein